MILAFKKIFIVPIIDGVKIHAIRQDINDNWKTGIPIRFHHQEMSFCTAVCVSTQKIEIDWFLNNGGKANESWGVMVYIDGVNVTTNEAIMNALIKNEGFPDRVSFFNFDYWHKANFTGKIIHWTDFKYEV